MHEDKIERLIDIIKEMYSFQVQMQKGFELLDKKIKRTNEEIEVMKELIDCVLEEAQTD